MAELLLGIDIGTYSSKGVLCRSDGTIVEEHALTTKCPFQNQGTPSMMLMAFGRTIFYKSQRL